jgi:hypothetical protein
LRLPRLYHRDRAALLRAQRDASPGVTWPVLPTTQGCFGGKTGARCNVENAHTWRYVGRTQQERHEVSCDRREGTVVPGRRFILVGQVLCHLAILRPEPRETKPLNVAGANPSCRDLAVSRPAAFGQLRCGTVASNNRNTGTADENKAVVRCRGKTTALAYRS